MYFFSLFGKIMLSARDPSKASTAYENIVNSIKAAEYAGQEALKAAELASITAVGEPIYGNSTSSLLSKSKHSKNKSNKLLQNAIKHESRLRGIIVELLLI